MLKQNPAPDKAIRDFFAQKHRASLARKSQKKHASNTAAFFARKAERRALARSIDPTPFLAANGFVVKKDGAKHFKIFDSADVRTEIVRLSYNSDAGCWLACGRNREQIGDSLQLLGQLYGYSYLDAVDALLRHAGINDSHISAAPVQKALRPAAAVESEPRIYPTLPDQTDADIEAGRAYLAGRGIDLATVMAAENCQALRYGPVFNRQSVLFVCIDFDDGMALSVTHRSVAGSFKGDLAGSDKAFPCILVGDTADDIVLVEGGVSGLAAQARARREGRLTPTVIVTGGASIMKFLENNVVRELLTAADLATVTLWLETETLSPKAIKRDAADTEEATVMALLDAKQARSDADHEKQIAGIEALGGPVNVTRARPANLRHKDVADLLLFEVKRMAVGTMLDAVKIVAAQDRDCGPERA